VAKAYLSTLAISAEINESSSFVIQQRKVRARDREVDAPPSSLRAGEGGLQVIGV